MNQKAVFILGTGHNGSTLLDLLLGSHSKAFSLGELDNFFRKNELKEHEVVCDVCEGDCDYWTSDLLKEINKANKKSGVLGNFIKSVNSSFTSKARLYKLLFSTFNSEVLIDSSKKPDWIKSSIDCMNNTSDIDYYLIYLDRDPRAVINSLKNKYKDIPLEQHVKSHQKKKMRIDKFFEGFSGKKLFIKYEDLALNPEETLEKVSDFIDLDFESSMLRFWQHEHHPIGGNSGTKYLLKKFKDNEDINFQIPNEERKKYYENHSVGIQLDERWKDELTSEELSIIQKVFKH